MNIRRIILTNQMEELMNIQGIGERNFLRLKPLVTIVPPKSAER
jgi:hypothetical protein